MRVAMRNWFWLSLFALMAQAAAAGDPTAGKTKATAACQVCHGLDGQATQPMAAHLSGQQEEYLVAQLQAYRSGRRQHAQMSIIARDLTDNDIADLAAWYASIEVTVRLPE